MRWLVMAFCVAVAAVMAYWAYGMFDAISSDPDTAPGFFIVGGIILSLGSLAAATSGIVLFVLWRAWSRPPR